MCTRSSSELRLVALLVATALTACGRRVEDPEEHAVRTTVVRYNERLVEAYRAGRPELLEGIASPADAARTSRLIAGLLSRGQYMDARQRELRFTQVKVSGSAAAADTEEKWVYEHRSIGERDKPVPSKEATYRLKYRLKRKGDGWMVDEVLELGGSESPSK